VRLARLLIISSKINIHISAHRAVSQDWRLEKAGARPVLDRRRLAETPNTPVVHNSDSLGLHSAVQNKASAHQLALPAIISCPIALVVRISNMVKCHSRRHTAIHRAADEDWRLEQSGARSVLDRRRPEFAPRDDLQYPPAQNCCNTEVVVNAHSMAPCLLVTKSPLGGSSGYLVMNKQRSSVGVTYQNSKKNEIYGRLL
jgi:hypothetical protein